MDVVIQRTFSKQPFGKWSIGLAGVPMEVLNPDPSFPDDVPAQLPTLHMADGTLHKMAPVDGDIESANVWISDDFWRFTRSTRTLEMPNGWSATYMVGETPSMLLEVHDPFGNQIAVTWQPYNPLDFFRRPEKFTQSVGSRTREVVFTYEVPWTTLPKTIAFDGRTWTYDYLYDPLSLDAVRPPAGPAWRFDYSDGLKVTTPNGGTVHYEFEDQVFPLEAPTARSVVRRRTTGGRAITAGAWTFAYAPAGPASTDSVGTVALPGDKTIEFTHGPAVFANRWLLTQKLLKVGGTVVSSFERQYEQFRTTASISPGQGQVYVPGFETIVHEGREYHTDYIYHDDDEEDRFGDHHRPWKIVETGEIAPGASSITRTTIRTYDYDFSLYRLDRVEKERVDTGSTAFEISRKFENATGFLEEETRYGVRTRLTNDGSGNVGSIRDDHNHAATSYTYDWGVVKNTITPVYTIERSIRSDGVVEAETQRGATTTFEFDALGRREWTKPPIGFGHWFQTRYDNDSGAWIEQRRSDGVTGGKTSWTKTTLDGFGRPIATENGVGVKTRIDYDSLGRTTFESMPYLGAAVVGTIFRHDQLDRVYEVEFTGGHKINYSYSNGVDVEITETDGSAPRTIKQDWEAFGDPSSPRLARLTDANGKVWSYQYNPLGRLTSVGQPGGTSRSWAYYPGTDLLQTETHPEHGTTDFFYDAAGLLERKVTPRGEFNHTYDDNDRLKTITAPGTNSPHSVTLEYDHSDNRTKVANGYVTSTFEFDAANRLKWRKDTIAGDQERQTTFHNDHWDNVWKIDYPSGFSVAYEFDSENRVTRAFREPGHVLAAEVEAYHASGAIERLRLGNNRVETFEYDGNRYWLKRLTGGPLNLCYDYDAVGNVKAIKDYDASPANCQQPGGTKSQSFTYDPLDRVASVGGYGANAFQYDDLGNRTWKQAGNVTYVYDASKRLDRVDGALPNPEVGEYAFDASGSMWSDPTGTYAYTPFDMLETITIGGVTTTTYRYDGDNVRRKRSRNTGQHEYFFHGAGGQLLSEWESFSGNVRWRRDYVYLGARLVASVRAGQTATVQWSQPTGSMSEAAETYGPTVSIVTSDGQPLEREAKVRYRTSGGTAAPGGDYMALDQLLTFVPGSLSGSLQAITVDTIPDTLWEGHETLVLTLSEPIDATLGTPAAHTVTILEDESPLYIDVPQSGSVVSNPFVIGGWAIDPVVTSGTGVDAVHLYAYPSAGGGPIFLGGAVYGDPRGDVAAIYGAQFTNSGYHLKVRLPPGTYQLTAYAHRTRTNAFDVVQTSIVTVVNRAPFDFGGDNKTDISVFRPSTSPFATWFIWRSETNSGWNGAWGSSGDVPVAADYDGDKATDFAVFRPSTGWWYVWRSLSQSELSMQWGTVAGDLPAPADYDGDGIDDIAIYRPNASGSVWWIWQSTTNTGVSRTWGASGDVPVPADYDGDGKVDVAVFRPSTGTWWIWQSYTNTTFNKVWGVASDIPMPGDYDGDGRADIAIFRYPPSADGFTWLIWQSVSQSGAGRTWGTSGDVPVSGDFDGDGKTDAAIYRPSTEMWWILQSSTNTSTSKVWGTAGDILVPRRPQLP
jgi:YD repeat-containing protein